MANRRDDVMLVDGSFLSPKMRSTCMSHLHGNVATVSLRTVLPNCDELLIEFVRLSRGGSVRVMAVSSFNPAVAPKPILR